MNLFYATDFADRLEREMIPALRAGFIVLTDRYTYSLMARATVRGADPQWVKRVYEFALKPDMIIYLRTTVDELVTRVVQTAGFNYWESGMDLRLGDDMFDCFVQYQGRLLTVFETMTADTISGRRTSAAVRPSPTRSIYGTPPGSGVRPLRAPLPPRALSIASLLRPYWRQMLLALVAVAGEAGAALLEPWPLKIVLDNLLQHRALPGWMAPAAAWLGGGSLAILNVAVVAVAAIAVAGALSSYLNTWLTATVGQWVMHDLRRTLYHHIHRLSLAEHDEKRTGDLIGRVTKDIESVQDFVTSALLGIVTNVLTLVGIVAVMLYLNWQFTLISLSVARAVLVVAPSAAHQARLARRPEEENGGVDRRSFPRSKWSRPSRVGNYEESGSSARV
jgi:hypothetical protein